VSALAAACLALPALAVQPVRADLLLDVTSPQVGIQSWWTLSATTDLRVTNTGVSGAFLNSANVALLVVQVSPTTSGTVTLALGAPASGSLFTDEPVSYDLVPGMTLSVPVTIDGTAYDTFSWGLVSNANANVDDVLGAGLSKSLATLTFTADSDQAWGVWRVYAVSESAFAWTGWTASEGVEGTFANVPQADGTAVLIATVAVPEPSTSAMLGAGAVAAGFAALRKRRPSGGARVIPGRRASGR
jgi:hypothetical protein